jgi:hypothetical protein
MAMVTDPCPRWAVFRMLRDTRHGRPSSQVSVLKDGDRAFLYVCHSLRVRDMAGNGHVLSVGIDVAPALESQGYDAGDVIGAIDAALGRQRGEAPVPAEAARAIAAVGRVLNIAWVTDAAAQPASIICPRSTACPRAEPCERHRASRATEIDDVREEILASVRRD